MIAILLQHTGKRRCIHPNIELTSNTTGIVNQHTLDVQVSDTQNTKNEKRRQQITYTHTR